MNYPPEEIYNPSILERKDFEYIILWMLDKNEELEWSNFTQKPIELKLSTLSKYLSLLTGKGFVDRPSRGHYKITSEGKKRITELSRQREEKRKFRYPPTVIRRRRNYRHWILWMIFNNDFCKWTDFLGEPLSINNSSLSRNMNLLMEKGLIIKEKKIYRITQTGKQEYLRMLKNYDLDRQSILDEESKRIEEITRNTVDFFQAYNINDEDLQFRFLNNILTLDYNRVETILSNKEDFDKIILFISMNHPDSYPNYISSEEFSNTYKIKVNTLTYFVDKILENKIYPIKFFELSVLPDNLYYFQEHSKLESALRVAVEGHITKSTYLNKLFSRSMDALSMMNNIVEEICVMMFNKGLKDSLKGFLPDYINYLAYKIEAKTGIQETYDKLEGIIWRDMLDIFESKGTEDLRGQYEKELIELNKVIELSPQNIELYYSKIKILIYFDQLEDAVDLLDKMLRRFPDNEKDIKLKKSSVFKRMLKIEAGLEIIDELIQNYPQDNDLLNIKAYWLQYLNKKEESIKLIKQIIKIEPNNATYHDRFGEILMFFKDYNRAIIEFQKTVELSSKAWFLYQTYIKLGICYKEIKKYKLAKENLNKGKKITNRSFSDPDVKQKWLALADLYLTEIERFRN
ncbi:MAG: hypothetical protein ACW972_02370 [Promethearchaeota archaeon]|jgi:tetratricopeptide (TPR) repeat protein